MEPLGLGKVCKTVLTNHMIEYTNMMADLMSAPKPKKTPSLSKMSEIPAKTTLSAIKKAPINLGSGGSKVTHITGVKKGGPAA